MAKLQIVAAIFASTLALPATAQDVYVSDPAHTFAHFETGHLGIAWIHGRFKANSKITLDRAARKGSIEAVIDTASLDSGHEGRDKHVRSPDYLDVEKFPSITFKADDLKFDGENLTGAVGMLTVYGVTKPVALNITSFKCIQHPANKRDMCGASATTAIKRSEFGVKRGATGIGDDVKITIHIEAVKQQ